jgi:hypothetical protein
MGRPLFLFGKFDATDLPSDEGRWVVLGVRGGKVPSREVRPEIETLDALLAEGANLFFILEPGRAAGCIELVIPVARALAGGGPSLAILVPRVEAPTLRARDDGAVRSFAITADLLRPFLSAVPDGLEGLAFEALRAAATGQVRPSRLNARQFPTRPRPSPAISPRPAAVIVPHRGRVEDLGACLDALSRAAGPGDAVRVGLDVDDPSDFARLVAAHPGVEFFAAEPAPSGPDAVRQALIERSPEGLIAFQDSDDLSCRDRLDILRAEIGRGGIDFVGSHELRVDELRGEVRAIRYPTDASAAMADGPGNPLLFPASMITAEAFRQAGGLSSGWPFANDTQFIFRSFFSARVANVDEFLYVRRRHAGSITTSPETGMGTPARSAQGRAWEADFRSVRDGRLPLADSSLAPTRPPAAIRLHRLGRPKGRPSLEG